MTQLLHIHSLGYTANNHPDRARKGGEAFGDLIPAPTWKEEVVKRNASVEQTVAEMKKLIVQSAWQTKRLSERLLGRDLYTTCRNVWGFLFSHIRYKEDDKGKEQLRTPALSWYVRRIRGIDCDDFSIFASTILYNLNIPHYLRIAKYYDEFGLPKDHFQHVYVVVPLKDKNYITIDAVLDEFDAEKTTAEHKDFLVMNNSNLNGIDVSVLGGVEQDTLSEISGILSGLDFEPIKDLEGLEGLENVDELEGLSGEDGEAILGAIRNHLYRTRDLVKKYPAAVATVEDPQTFGAMLDYGLQYWDTPQREQALGVLSDKEDELNSLLGLADLGDNAEDTQLFYGMEGLGGMSVLGRVKAKKQFFKTVKKTVQKVNAGIKRTGTNIRSGAKKAGAKAKKVAKKVGRTLIRTNPLTVAARAGMLAAMKTNFLKIASKLKWGYLTEAEAREHGFDMTEWQKSKTALTKAEKLFVNTLKGKAEAFKKAILTGRAGGLSGLDGELGVVTAAAAGASLTAAMPFIKKLVELVKLINPGKLISKVKANRLAKKQKSADTMPEADEEAQSAQPDAPPGNAEDAEIEEPSETEQSTTENTDSEPSQSSQPSGQRNPEQADQEAENTSGTENLPAAKSSGNSPEAKTDSTAQDPGPVAKVIDWVKENPGKSALFVGGAILLGLSMKSGPHRTSPSLGRKAKGKSQKGKRKTNPPRAISGTGKKKNKKPKYKNNPRKGKGGGPKRVTL